MLRGGLHRRNCGDHSRRTGLRQHQESCARRRGCPKHGTGPVPPGCLTRHPGRPCTAGSRPGRFTGPGPGYGRGDDRRSAETGFRSAPGPGPGVRPTLRPSPRGRAPTPVYQCGHTSPRPCPELEAAIATCRRANHPSPLRTRPSFRLHSRWALQREQPVSLLRQPTCAGAEAVVSSYSDIPDPDIATSLHAITRQRLCHRARTARASAPSPSGRSCPCRPPK